MGMDNKQYPIGFKPQAVMPQGQILRQQLQVRLVSLITDRKTLLTKKQQLSEILISCWSCSLKQVFILRVNLFLRPIFTITKTGIQVLD